jgi:hypothetical protein
MLALLGIQSLATWVVDYHGHMMGARIEARLRAELFAHVQRLSFGFHDRSRTGQLMIPARIDQNPCAQSRLPMDRMRHGWSMRSFQAAQQWATMSS